MRKTSKEKKKEPKTNKRLSSTEWSGCHKRFAFVREEQRLPDKKNCLWVQERIENKVREECARGIEELLFKS